MNEKKFEEECQQAWSSPQIARFATKYFKRINKECKVDDYVTYPLGYIIEVFAHTKKEDLPDPENWEEVSSPIGFVKFNGKHL